VYLTRFTLASNEKLPIATTKCRAAFEQSVSIRYKRIHGITDFGYIGLATQYPLVQLLDVVILYREVEIVLDATIY
jgi:hypothetical protein